MFHIILEDIKNLRSSNGQPTRIKFSNRTHEVASIDWIDTNGSRKHIKDIPPKRAWTYDTLENHVFVAYEKGHKHDELALNYGWFWKVNKAHNPQFVEKIMITEGDYCSILFQTKMCDALRENFKIL